MTRKNPPAQSYNTPALYRQAEESDLDATCALIQAAVRAMEARGIFQWDGIYPARADFLADIQKRQLSVGTVGGDIVVVYAVNDECDAEYRNGTWHCPDGDFRVIHRLCVLPAYWNRGIAKSALARIERELQDAKVGSVRLDVFGGNPAALSLYLHAGYKTVGFADWRMGRFHLMEKLL